MPGRPSTTLRAVAYLVAPSGGILAERVPVVLVRHGEASRRRPGTGADTASPVSGHAKTARASLKHSLQTVPAQRIILVGSPSPIDRP